jgi:threonine dehydrogenase-like Zn-dependent dehydrogenase
MSETTTGYAVTITAHQTAELLETPVDDRPLEPDAVAGRTLFTLTSPGTELNHAYLGERFPKRVGYAAVFTVEQVGAEVDDVKPGEVVFAMGGHVSHQRVPRAEVVPVPAGLAAEHAVFARLMGVSMTTLVTTAAAPGQSVAVTGLGPVGHLAAQIFAGCGYDVLAVDPVESRRALLQRKADLTVADRLTDEAVAGRTLRLGLECSGHEQAVLDLCRHVAKRGEVALIGVPWRKRTDLSAFDLLDAVFHKYVVLRTGWEWELPRQPEPFRRGSVVENFATALRWLAEGRVDVAGLYALADPRDCQRVYQDLLHQRGDALAYLFDWRNVHDHRPG